MLAWYMLWPSVHLSLVHHKSAFYQNRPVFVVLMLQSANKCRNVFMFYVLFEHSFPFELFGLMTAKLQQILTITQTMLYDRSGNLVL